MLLIFGIFRKKLTAAERELLKLGPSEADGGPNNSTIANKQTNSLFLLADVKLLCRAAIKIRNDGILQAQF